MEPSYDLFDHTADMGIRVRAASLPELLTPAGEGLYAVIGALVTRGDPKPITIELSGDDPSLLLRDYLDELLVLFERDQRRFTTLDTTVFDHCRLVTTIRTERVDQKRTVYAREVKAITYHELAIRSIPGGFEATVIVDI